MLLAAPPIGPFEHVLGAHVDVIRVDAGLDQEVGAPSGKSCGGERADPSVRLIERPSG